MLAWLSDFWPTLSHFAVLQRRSSRPVPAIQGTAKAASTAAAIEAILGNGAGHVVADVLSPSNDKLEEVRAALAGCRGQLAPAGRRRMAEALAARLMGLRLAVLPRETGGVLLGVIDTE